MTKPIKIATIIIGSILALIIICMILVLVLVDPNDYKGTIANVVKEKTGRELTFKGDMSLTFYPWFGLALGPLSLSNAPGFGDQPFARIDKARLGVKIMPLLSGKLEMDKILLDGLGLNLERNKQGKTNWDDLVAQGKAETVKPAPKPEGDKSEFDISEFSVNGIQITSARISWDDKQHDAHYLIEDFNLDVGELRLGKPFDFELGFQLKSAKPDLLIIPAMTGTAVLDTAQKTYLVNNLHLTVTAQGDQLPDKEVKLTMTSNVAADLSKETVKVSDLIVETLDMKAQGDLQASKIQTSPSFEGSLNLAEFNPRNMLEKLGIKGIGADENTLKRASASFVFSGGTNSFTLRTLDVQLDDTTVKGAANVTKFDPPTATFKVDVNTLDLDRYMPPPGKTAQAEKPAPGKETPPAGKPDFEGLRKLNIKGDVTIGDLKANNLRMRDIKIHLAADNGVVSVDPLTAQFYEGTLNTKLAMDVKTDTPKLSVISQIDKAQAGPLLKDLTGQERLTGSTVVKLNVTSVGMEPESIKNNLNGNVSFGFYNGAIKGVNIAKMVRDALNTLKGQPNTKDEPMQTDFAELLGTVDITDGVAHNKDLILKSPLLRVSGEGEINLRNDTLDYLLKADLVGTLKGQGGASADELTNIPAPIRISGSLQDPKYSLDVKELARALAEGQLKEPVKQVEESIKKKLFGDQKGADQGSTTPKSQELLKKFFK